MNFFSFILHLVILSACYFLHKFDLTVVSFLVFGFYILYLISEIESIVYKILENERGRY